MNDLAEQLAAVWPADRDLDERDVEAVEELSKAIARLSDSLGNVMTGYLLVTVGRKIGLS